MKKLSMKKEFLVVFAILTMMVMFIFSNNVYATSSTSSSTSTDDLFSVVTPGNTGTYTITFDNNGGTGTMTPVTKNSGESYTLPSSTFTAPSGKQFDGWDVNGTTKKVGEVIIINANTTVKAIWKDTTPVTPTPTPTNNSTSSYQNSTLPQTGDASDYVIFAIIAVAIVVAVYAYRKTKKYNF